MSENSGYTVHTLRYTFTNLLYLYSKADIVVIQEILGQSCIEVRQVYIHLVLAI